MKQVARLVSAAKNKRSTVELTFHRAIDMTRDLQEAANAVARLGSADVSSALFGPDTRRLRVGFRDEPALGASRIRSVRVMAATLRAPPGP